MSNEELDRIESSDNHRLALEQIVIAKDLPCTMRSVQQEIRCERERAESTLIVASVLMGSYALQILLRVLYNQTRPGSSLQRVRRMCAQGKSQF